MLNNINALSLHRVFHGIRFKVNKWSLGCRETTFSFLRTFLSLLFGKQRKQALFSGHPKSELCLENVEKVDFEIIKKPELEKLPVF